MYVFFFFKQNTAYEMRISDWSSDVCSSDLEVLVHRIARIDAVLDAVQAGHEHRREGEIRIAGRVGAAELDAFRPGAGRIHRDPARGRTVALGIRSDERRVGKAGVSTWSIRLSPII